MKLGAYLFTVSIAISAIVNGKSHKIPCQSSNKTMTCANKMLRTIPKFPHLNDTETLDMSGNDMEELFSANFNGLAQLKYLYLTYNSIDYIEDSTFEDLHELEYLDLSNNILEDIPDNVVINNKKLITLDLSRNIFNMQTPIIISDSLEVLDLSFSKVAVFNEDHLKNLPNLRVLNLNSNNLETLNADIFAIPENFLYVELLYNTWKCNCDTIKLFKKLEHNKFIEIKEPVSCMEAKRFIHIFDVNGPISPENYCNKKKNEARTKHEVKSQETTTKFALEKPTSVVVDSQQISNELKSLELILENEKLYFQEIRNHEKFGDSVTFFNVLILTVLVFLSGIGIGVVMSNIKYRSARNVRKSAILEI